MMESFFHIDDRKVIESAVLQIAGARCALRTNSKVLLRTVERWRTIETPHSPHAFQLNVFVREELDEVPSEPHFRGVSHVVFASWRGACFAVFDLLRCEITAAISRRCADDTTFWNGHFLPITLGVLGPAINAVPVHCACLHGDGTGLLIAGESGAGKSTMAVALAMRGMSLISDDWTYVSAERSGPLSAHGVHAPVKLLPDALAHFPSLRSFDTTIALNGELSYEVDPAEAFRVTVKSACQPTVLVFLRRIESGPARLSRMDARVALRYLINSSERLPGELHQAHANRQRVFEMLSSLPCYLFQYSGSPHSGAAALHGALADLTTARSNNVFSEEGSSFSIQVPPPPDLLQRFVARPFRGTTAIGHTRLALETNDAGLLRALGTADKRRSCADHATWKCTVVVDGTPDDVPRRLREPIRKEDVMVVNAGDVIAVRHEARTFICVDTMRRELLIFVDPALSLQTFADLVRTIVHDCVSATTSASEWATAL